ncbi:MAG: hypothetical protein MHM6MM_004141 [Cercozoa sp. M6MM]
MVAGKRRKNKSFLLDVDVQQPQQKRRRKVEDDEEIASESEEEFSETEVQETREEVKVRKAKEYLQQIQSGPLLQVVHDDEEEEGNELVEKRDAVDAELQRQFLASKNQLFVPICDRIGDEVSHTVKRLKATPTCVTVQDEGPADTSPSVFLGTKSGSVSEYCTRSFQRKRFLHGTLRSPKQAGHRGAVYALALSQDSRFLLSAGADRNILVWDTHSERRKEHEESSDTTQQMQPRQQQSESTEEVDALLKRTKVRTSDVGQEQHQIRRVSGRSTGHFDELWNGGMQLQHVFRKAHRDSVLALDTMAGGVGETAASQELLFSTGADRSLRVFSLRQLDSVDTLYGHQDDVTALQTLPVPRKRRVLTCGADRTARIFKVADETQLVFRGHRGIIECVRFVSEQLFVTCAQDGAVCLWSTMKKKPVHGVLAAHDGHGVSAIAACFNTDLVASGSCDGTIKLWKVDTKRNKLLPLRTLALPLKGWVNALTFSRDGRQLFAAVGRDEKLGRWQPVPKAKNALVAFELWAADE